MRSRVKIVTPAKAGAQLLPLPWLSEAAGNHGRSWVPAFAGMTISDRTGFI
jgi:hypothetical protein